MRYFSSTATAKTLTEGMTDAQTTIKLNNTTGLPASVPFTLVIDPDTASEEIVLVSAVGGTDGATYTIVRGNTTLDGVAGGNGTSAVAHDSGATVKHMVTARDLQEPQTHMAATAAVHGVAGTLVGTTDTQTLTNKTLVSPTVSGSGSVTASSLSISSSASLPANTSIGSVSSTEIGYLDGVTEAVQTQLDTLDSTVLALDSEVSTAQATADRAAPTGVVQAYLGTSAPTGWLLCDGTAVSRTTYSALFALFGTRYGVGDGTTTFNLPDLRSRFLRGAADTATLSGTVAGADTHTHTGSAISSGGHTHTYSGTVDETGSGNQKFVQSGTNSGTVTALHQHTYSGTTATGGVHSHSLGVDSANNIPANFGINWIVKA